jgi:hypothetical protein
MDSWLERGKEGINTEFIWANLLGNVHFEEQKGNGRLTL